MGSFAGMADASKVQHKQKVKTLSPLLTAEEEEVIGTKEKEFTQVKEVGDDNIRLDVEANWNSEPDVTDVHVKGKATWSDVHSSQHRVASTSTSTVHVDDNFVQYSTSTTEIPLACTTAPKVRQYQTCKELAANAPTLEWSVQSKSHYNKRIDGFQPWMQRAGEGEKFEALCLLAQVAEDAKAASACVFTHGSINPFAHKKSTRRSMRVSDTDAAVHSRSNSITNLVTVAEASSSDDEGSSIYNQHFTSQQESGNLDSAGSSKHIPAGPLFQSKRRKKVTLPQRLGDFVIQLPKKRHPERNT